MIICFFYLLEFRRIVKERIYSGIDIFCKGYGIYSRNKLLCYGNLLVCNNYY